MAFQKVEFEFPEAEDDKLEIEESGSVELIFQARRLKKISQSLQNLKLNLKAKRILLMTTLKLKLLTIRQKLIETARRLNLQRTSQMTNLRITLIRSASVFSILVRDTMTSVGLKKKLTAKVKSLNASLSSLWKRTKS